MVRVVETTAVRGMILLCALNGLGASATRAFPITDQRRLFDSSIQPGCINQAPDLYIYGYM